MLLLQLYERASLVEDEEDFQLSHEEILKICKIDDVDLAGLLVWLHNSGVDKQELVEVSKPSQSWVSFKLESNSYRTRLHSFISYLMYKNPILIPMLTKVSKKI